MDSASFAIFIWGGWVGVRLGLSRVIILRTDSLNVPQRPETSKSIGMPSWPPLNRIIHRIIDMCVWVGGGGGGDPIPRYMRRPRNISAGCLARWIQYERDQKMYAE